MDLQTISQVSKEFNISTRTLRFYEEKGLIKSIKKDEYAYRTYDEAAIMRLQQIIILRKLRIPLKQINLMLQNKDTEYAIDVFKSNLKEVQDEITALSTIRSVLRTFIAHLNRSAPVKLNIDLLKDESMLKLIDTLTATKINFKEEKSMEGLNKASQNLSKLKDVRIIYLPPATVISSHFIGENPEDNCSKPLDKFVRESGLCRIKPDLRHYGFNNPCPSDNSPVYGYERWVTIPDDMEVPEQFEKKKFKGGLYAAHMIPIGAFEEWQWLADWVKQNHKYEMIPGDPENMFGWLEEHLNYVNYVQLPKNEPYDLQLDLLIPIRERV